MTINNPNPLHIAADAAELYHQQYQQLEWALATCERPAFKQFWEQRVCLIFVWHKITGTSWY